MEKIIRNSICAIVVTYNPNIQSLTSNMNRYSKGVDKIIIVDNSEKSIDYNQLLDIIDNLSIIKLNENFGIAYAQNIGIDKFLETNIEYCIFFDQDSSLSPENIHDLLKTYKFLVNKKVALVGPSIKVEKKAKICEVNETLSSGSLIHRNVIKDVGYMKDELFIDLVDYEWCWRAKKKMYKIYVNNKVVMEHKLGEGKIGFFGIPSPMRHYYQFRNSLLLMQSKDTPIKFKLKYIFILPIKYIFFSLIIKDSKIRRKYINCGIKDGILGKYGKF